MKEKERRGFFKLLLISLGVVFITSFKKNDKIDIPEKSLKEADFYKKHNLAG